MSAEIAVLHHAPDRVGESPLWDAAAGCLWWVDILGHAVRRADPETGATRSYAIDIPPGALALTYGNDDLIVAAAQGWVSLDRENGATRPMARPEAPAQGWRMNDGCVDTGGRFWAGSIDEPRGSGAGGILWRLGPSGPVEVLRGLGVQNGMAVSPDGATLYLSDSHPSAAVVWAFDLDATGEIANRRVFHRPETGRPDGGATDIDGCYWFAAIDAGRIVQLDPEGREIRAIDLPVSRPTKPAFCGPDLSTLAVTTMSEVTEGEALAGAMLLLDPGTRGWHLPRAHI
jgi:L-arabinonolactonase